MKILSRPLIGLTFAAVLALGSQNAAASVGLQLPAFKFPRLDFSFLRFAQVDTQEHLSDGDNGEKSDKQSSSEVPSKTTALPSKSTTVRKVDESDQASPPRARAWRSMLPGEIK